MVLRSIILKKVLGFYNHFLTILLIYIKKKSYWYHEIKNIEIRVNLTPPTGSMFNMSSLHFSADSDSILLTSDHLLPFTVWKQRGIIQETPLRAKCEWPYVPFNENYDYWENESATTQLCKLWAIRLVKKGNNWYFQHFAEVFLWLYFLHQVR